MSNALYLDCHAGIAGDILPSVLVGLGASPSDIEREFRKLPIDNFRLSFRKEMKQGIHAMTLSVDFHKSHHHRTASSIFKVTDKSDLDDGVKMRSKSIFEMTGHAEVKIHGMSIKGVHFHKVDAMDSIIGIVRGCIALELFNIDHLYCPPISTGNGKIGVTHGIYPVPAPATAEILKSIPLADFDIHDELTAPIGAAIAKSLVTEFGPLPTATMHHIRYGARTRNFDFPDVIRAIRFTNNGTGYDQIQVLECQMDDMAPETLGHFMDTILQNDVLDIYYSPIIMKKNRPATQLTIIYKVKNKLRIEELILKHASSLGVRSCKVNHRVLDRAFRDIQTPYGDVSIKLSLKNGKIFKIKPGYEDLRIISKQTEQPFQQIYHRVMKSIYQFYGVGDTLKK